MKFNLYLIELLQRYLDSVNTSDELIGVIPEVDNIDLHSSMDLIFKAPNVIEAHSVFSNTEDFNTLKMSFKLNKEQLKLLLQKATMFEEKSLQNPKQLAKEKQPSVKSSRVYIPQKLSTPQTFDFAERLLLNPQPNILTNSNLTKGMHGSMNLTFESTGVDTYMVRGHLVHSKVNKPNTLDFGLVSKDQLGSIAKLECMGLTSARLKTYATRPGKQYLVFKSQEDMQFAVDAIKNEYPGEPCRIAGQKNTVEISKGIKKLIEQANESPIPQRKQRMKL